MSVHDNHLPVEHLQDDLVHSHSNESINYPVWCFCYL